MRQLQFLAALAALLLPNASPQTQTIVTTLAGSGIAALTNGVGSAAAFNGPRGTCSPDGVTIHVADRINNVIRSITPTGATTVFAGSTVGSVDGSGTFASLNSPIACTFDAANTMMFILEWGASRVRSLNMTTLNTTTLAGSTAGFVDGQGSNAQFNFPAGIAFLAPATLFVADTGNNAIRALNLTTGIVTTVAGSNVSTAFSGPRGVAVTPAGLLYVADQSNNRIRTVSPSGSVSTFVGFFGQVGNVDATGTNARFSQPYGVTLDAGGNLYVTDSGSCAVRVVTPAGIVTTLGGGVCLASTASPQPGFDGPSWPAWGSLGQVSGSVVFLASGGIAVADFSLARVRIIKRVACGAGFYCASPLSPPVNCPANFFCPVGASAPTPCPANGTTLYVGAAASGACIAPAPTNASVTCNATAAAVAAGTLLSSQLIALPNVTDAAPLLVLSAAAPANAAGVDIVVATAAACAAYANAAAAGGAPTCGAATYPIAGVTYYYLGTASALGMIAAPVCVV
jgi:NHL repeat